MREIEIGEDNVTLEFTDQDIKVILNAFLEVHKEIDEWEFFTRMGITNQEADDITNSLEKVYEKIHT